MAALLTSLIRSFTYGDRSWSVGVCATLLCVAIVFAVALYLIHYRAVIARFRRMRSPEATFEAGADRICITSDIGTSELTWSAVTEIWQFPDYWLLFFSRAQFMILPLADFDPEAREFILDRAKSHGAKIA